LFFSHNERELRDVKNDESTEADLVLEIACLVQEVQPELRLLDFFMHRVLTQGRIVFTQFHPAGGCSAVFGGYVAGSAGCFGAFKNHLNAVAFCFSHLLGVFSWSLTEG
jgi:hypothetical protein